jgi:hypothetical protein
MTLGSAVLERPKDPVRLGLGPEKQPGVTRINAEAFIKLTHMRPPCRDYMDNEEWDSLGPGSLVHEQRGGDTVLVTGLDLLNFLTGSATGGYGRVAYSAIGTGVAAVVGSDDAALGSEVYRGTYSWSKDSARGSSSLDRVFTIGSTYAIRESGLFSGSGVFGKGTMYSRGTFAVRNVVANDTITLNYTKGFTAG